MRNNALNLNSTVCWYIGQKRCEGRIIDIYNRRGDESISPEIARERVLLIELEDGKKVVKLESTVMLVEQKRYG